MNNSGYINKELDLCKKEGFMQPGGIVINGHHNNRHFQLA